MCWKMRKIDELRSERSLRGGDTEGLYNGGSATRKRRFRYLAPATTVDIQLQILWLVLVGSNSFAQQPK